MEKLNVNEAKQELVKALNICIKNCGCLNNFMHEYSEKIIIDNMKKVKSEIDKGVKVNEFK